MADFGHYTINGIDYPRVTSIINILAKPALARWMGRVGLEEADRIAKASRDLGTRVHAACEAVTTTGELPADRTLAPWAEAYRAWLNRHVHTVVSTERLIHSARYLYAGTADLVAVMDDGTLAVLDLKTSKSLDCSYRLQLAAYQAALCEAGEPCLRRIVLHLPASSPGVLRAVEYHDTAADFAAFLAALQLWIWHEQHKDDWRTS